jgi:hypothetical protein
MMGGTELNLKRARAGMEVELEAADWMSKPESDMTEEERAGLRAHRQKEKEQKDKRRKAWE